MGLLDGGVAAIFSSAFEAFYLDASLYRGTLTDDGAGGGVQSFASPEAIKAQLDATTEAMQSAEGFVDTDQRILVLAYGVDPLSTDDEIQIGATRWQIASVNQDPAQAYYELRGRRASNNGS